MALGGTYNTGLLQVANGSVAVSGHGVAWVDVMEGDWIQVGVAVGMIEAVDDTFENITLMNPWPGPSSPNPTISIGSPATVTLADHGLAPLQPVAFTTTGALPGGLTPGVTYYVCSTGITTDTFNISATAGGVALNTTGSQSGVHTLAQSYVVMKMSWQRYDPALTQAKLREFVTNIEAAGIFLFVSGAEPDPAMGENGQYALKCNTNAPWQLWYMIGGVWVLQGSAVGMNWLGPWNSLVGYLVGNGVSRLGSTYICTAPNTNAPPESNPSDWGLLATGGDRYDIAIWASDRPDSGETLLRLLMPTTVTFSAGMAQSQANALTAGTASAVFSLQQNGTEFATVTFTAGDTDGSFACASDTVFNSGDILTIVTPNPRDATLANISLTITGFR